VHSIPVPGALPALPQATVKQAFGQENPTANPHWANRPTQLTALPELSVVGYLQRCLPEKDTAAFNQFLVAAAVDASAASLKNYEMRAACHTAGYKILSRPYVVVWYSKAEGLRSPQPGASPSLLYTSPDCYWRNGETRRT
jgi:hypothetical protein